MKRRKSFTIQHAATMAAYGLAACLEATVFEQTQMGALAGNSTELFLPHVQHDYFSPSDQ